MSSSVHKRWSFRGFYGDLKSIPVIKANMICINVTVILCVLVHRGVYFLTEQPGSSCQFSFNCLFKLLKFLGLTVMRKMNGRLKEIVPGIFTYMRMFGHWSSKPTRLVGTLPGAAKWLAGKWSRTIEKTRKPQLRKKLKKLNWLHGLQFKTAKLFMKRHLARRKKLEMFFTDKSGWVCGGKNMKDSASYTFRFGDMVRKAHVAWLFSIGSYGDSRSSWETPIGALALRCSVGLLGGS